MAKIRVHELAKELNIPSKDLVKVVQDFGIDVKNHMSTMEDAQAEWVKRKLAESKAPAADRGKAAERPAKEAERKTAAPTSERTPIRTDRTEPQGAPAPNRPRPETDERRAQPPYRPEGQPPAQQRYEGQGQGQGPRPPYQGQDRGPRPPYQGQGQGQGPRPPYQGQGQGQGPRPPYQGQGPRPPYQGQGPRPPYQGQGQGQGPRPPYQGQGQGQRPPYQGQGQGQGPRPPYQGQGQGQRPPYQGQGQGPRPPYQGQGQGPRPPYQGQGGQRPPYQGQGGQRPPYQGQGQGPRPPYQGQGQGQGPRRGPGGPRPMEIPKPPESAIEAQRQRAKQTPKQTDAKKQYDQQRKQSVNDTREFHRSPRPKKKMKRADANQEMTPEMIAIPEKITVRDLADRLIKSPAELIKKLLMLGITATQNQDIDYEMAELLASDFNVKVEHEKTEEELILEEIVDDAESLRTRPPVVTVMGHVDHGKTSLLDAIRETNVVSKEAGGITQHIGAYQVEINGQKITFIDTPGHEAFTAMRARGAQATDLAILVVAADDGVMPQTMEAINHARAAAVPMLIAVNKIDKPSANPDRVKQQLAEHNLVPEDWGGDTVFVNVSAKSRVGIEHLLEMILLVSEIKELKANPDRQAEGVVIEAQLDKLRGPVATILVQKGTLKIGDPILCGTSFGKVKAMVNDLGERVTEAPPSMPVEVLGLTEVAMAGDRFRAVDDKVARQVSALRLSEKKREEQTRTAKVSLDDLFKQIKEGDVKELNLIVKGDVQGSVEALITSLLRLSTDEVKVNVIHSGVGAVKETDVMLATASNAIIIGFNVRPEGKARKYAEDEKIDVRMYRVIYEALEDIKKAMAGLLEPEKVEVFQGRIEVRATFKVPKIGVIAGGYVLEGKVTRNSNIRVLRESVVIHEGKLSSLKRFKDDVREVLENYECGIGIDGFNDLKEGDIIEAYVIQEVPRKL